MNEVPTETEEKLLPEGKESKNMGFLDHLEDLRWTLFKSLAVFILAVVVVAVFLKLFASFLNWPMESAMAEMGVEDRGLVMISPLGVFSVLIQVCFLGGFGLSLPFVMFFVAQFLAPALEKTEIKMLVPACMAALLLFLVGAAFSYSFLVPETLKMSIRLNSMLGYEIFWSADRYYSLLCWMILGMALCFQFPLILYLLVYLRIVTTATLRKSRRYMIVLFFFLGALLTPTWDPFTQSMVALPMWILFEISLILATKTETKREKEMDLILGDDEENED